jgi:uncharacterized protein
MQTTTENNFLDLARLGKNEWWRYLSSVMLILFFWLAGSFVLAFFLLASILFNKDSGPIIDPNTGQMSGGDPFITVIILLLSFLPLLAGLLLAVRFVHQRPIISLITSHPRIDWKRIGIGFLTFGTLVGLSCIIEALLYPGRYQFTFDPLETLKFLPVVLILVPLQAAAEELLFRGYMMQGLGLLTRRAWIVVAISSLVFMLLHVLNPEAQANTLLSLGSYLTIGLLFALVTVRDNRLELVIGMHIANNVFVLVVNNAVSALPVPSVFTVTTLDAGYNLLSSLAIALVFYAGLSLNKRMQASQTENK